MKTNFKFLTILLVISLVSCKNEGPSLEYKYADKPVTITCDNLDSKLYQEALYTFEDDILKFYGKNNPKTSLIQAYSQFTRNANSGRIKYEAIVSAHTVDVFKALKNENKLWDANNIKSHLDYNGPLLSCIANNITDVKLQTTLNALLSINRMSPKLFGPPLLAKYRTVLKDRYLATYIAFDLFYAKLFDIDFSKVNLDKPESKVDFNKVPK